MFPGCRLISLLRRLVELNRFYEECLAEAESRSPRSSTPRRQDSASGGARSPFAVKVKSEKGTQSPASKAERPQKRVFERESRVLSPHKRIKQEGAGICECIEIFDSSD